MARIALVSRNPVMAMALTSGQHSATELRPHELDGWLEAGEELGVDALVLDLGSPDQACRVIGDLRAQGRWIPALVVTTGDAEWGRSGVAQLPGVEVLELPLTPDKLEVALSAVLRHPRAAPPSRIDPLLDPVPDLAAAPLPDLLNAERLSTTESPREPSAVSAGSTGSELIPEDPVESTPPNEPEESSHADETSAVPYEHTASPVEPAERRRQIPAVPFAPAPAPSRSLTKLASPEGASHLRLDPSDPPAATLAPNYTSPASDPLRRLLEEAEERYTLEEISTVIVDDAVARVNADAAALLLPDGEIWRVAAGVGLRPLEYRLQLTADSWLVDRTATAGKGILIQDSDVARLDLRGAPLASRTHLMAVPVPEVGAIMVLARERSEPFTEQSLAALATLATESVPLLAEAIDLRSLARILARHLDEPMGR